MWPFRSKKVKPLRTLKRSTNLKQLAAQATKSLRSYLAYPDQDRGKKLVYLVEKLSDELKEFQQMIVRGMEVAEKNKRIVKSFSFKYETLSQANSKISEKRDDLEWVAKVFRKYNYNPSLKKVRKRLTLFGEIGSGELFMDLDLGWVYSILDALAHL